LSDYQPDKANISAAPLVSLPGNEGWKKPGGMHWRTFERLNTAHDAFAAISLAGTATRLKPGGNH